MTVTQFLSNGNFLTAILTLFPASLQEDDGVARLPHACCDLRTLNLAWPATDRIQNKTPDQLTPDVVEQAVKAANADGPRLILANSRIDDPWLAEVIVNWLK